MTTDTPHHEQCSNIKLERILEDMEATDLELSDLVIATLEDNPLPAMATVATASQI